MAKNKDEDGPLFDRLEKLTLVDGKIYWTVSGEGQKMSGRMTSQMALYVLFRLGEIFLTGAPVTPIKGRDDDRRRNAS